MALQGLKPWVYTITPFLIERPFEQIKLDIDQQKSNVKLVGFADYPSLGPSHSELNAKKRMFFEFSMTSVFYYLKSCRDEQFENSSCASEPVSRKIKPSSSKRLIPLTFRKKVNKESKKR